MTATNAIAGLIPTVQATALLGHNIRLANAKKKKLKHLMGAYMGNVVGVSMIKDTSNIIKGL